MSRTKMAVPAALCVLIALGCAGQTTGDAEAIKNTASEYMRGWYTGDADRMAKTLHPSFVSRIVENPDAAEPRVTDLNRDAILAMTALGGGKSVPKDSFKIEITVLDARKNIASVLATSQYDDYMHLVKVGNQWRIMNILWDYKRSK